MKKDYTILSFDTSCDETSVAVTMDDRVMVNVISSQVDLHKKWGGVVPMIAKRAHQDRIETVTKEALARFSISTNKMQKTRSKQHSKSKPQSSNLLSIISNHIDAIAVTYGPGLAPALEVGVDYAKKLAKEHNKLLIAVNHMEGHLLSPFAKNSKGKGSGINVCHSELDSESTQSHRSRIKSGMTISNQNDNIFPLLGLLISGGHTELVLMKGFGNYELVGQTLDDAVGEAYDKVAKLLGLGYPGGPIVEELAKQGDPLSYDLPIPMKGRKDCNFSYSGLKTAVRYLVQELELDKQTICDVTASFQRVAIKSLIDRLEKGVLQIKPKGILLGGGVVSNLYVRAAIRTSMKQHNLPVYIPYSKKLFTDNAAMIGVAAYHQAIRDDYWHEPELLDRVPNLHF